MSMTREEGVEKLKTLLAAKPVVGASHPAELTAADAEQLKGFDLSILTKLLPWLAMLIPGIGPFIPIITAAIPIIMQLIELFGVEEARKIVAEAAA